MKCERCGTEPKGRFELHDYCAVCSKNLAAANRERERHADPVGKALAHVLHRLWLGHETAVNIEVALIGGAALQLYGSDRLTRDIDIVTAEVPEGIEFKNYLSFGGIGGMMSESRVPIDVVVRDDKWAKLYEAALVYAVHVTGVPIPVVQAEYILAMKLVVGRDKDVEDLKFLVLDAGIDYEAAKEIVAEFLGPYAADELDRFKEEVEWERSKGRS